ncbi:hypothetical protein [Candidatus Thioglobus sp.]|uniref:hypothetical protein n=1 Tax=Candidatus Thioglobus sp. TaxID=2026721 RepID=UPI0026291DB6|nr:hypothetical protein [Candidatus Thioglobus sp.]
MNLQKLLKISVAVQLAAIVAIIGLVFVGDTADLHPLLQEYLAWEEENILLGNGLMAIVLIVVVAYLVAMFGLWNFNKWAKPVYIVTLIASVLLTAFTSYMSIYTPLEEMVITISSIATGFTLAILFTDIELNQPFKWSVVIAPIALLLVMVALFVFYFI